MRSCALTTPPGALRPEVDLLLCCARPPRDTTRAARIKALVQAPLCWDTLLARAARHGLTPLLAWHLHATCPAAVPPAHLAALRAAAHTTALANAFWTDALLTLLALFEAHGLPVLPYKGPTLALGVYGDLALRPFSDLDLLVPARAFTHATALLRAQGFRLYRAFEAESCLVHATTRITVDLHRGLVPPRFHFPLDFARVWQARQPLALAGTPVATLAPEDLLIVLCVQAVRDAWEALPPPRAGSDSSLLKIGDIGALLQASPGLDWERVLADMRRLGGQRMLLFGLCLASELLGTALPEAIQSRVQALPALGGLTAHVRTQWGQAAAGSVARSLTRARFHFALRERWRDRLFPYLYGAVLLFVPSDHDRRFLPLPAGLAWLSYGIRPLRVVRAYGLRRVWQHLYHWLTWSP